MSVIRAFNVSKTVIYTYQIISTLWKTLKFSWKKWSKNLEIGNKRVYLCTRNQEMTPKAIEEVRGVEELIYRQFLMAIVLQDGVRRKASKKNFKKTLQKVWRLKTKALLLHPLSKRKTSSWFWGFENKFWKKILKKMRKNLEVSNKTPYLCIRFRSWKWATDKQERDSSLRYWKVWKTASASPRNKFRGIMTGLKRK